jgi:septal ring factor EnvC (AmiA/AmiB activator)
MSDEFRISEAREQGKKHKCQKNWKNITLGILGVIFIYLIVRVFTPTPDMSELNKYKLEQIDKHIEEMKNLQISLSDSIQTYQNKITEIDEKISKIKVERKEVNNYYTQKKEEIKNADKKQIDSLLRSRYNF